MNEYGAVVLYYRRGIAFRSTLDDLLTQSVAPSEVVVVDNASGDGIVDSMRRDYPMVNFISARTNLGYAGGMNLGIAALVGEVSWVLCLTHEVRLQQNCLAEMLGAAGDDSGNVIQAGPVLRFLGTSEIWSRGGSFTKSGAPLHLVEDRGQGRHERVDWLDGSCTLTRFSAFEKYGYFDEDFYLYWEDVEISTRYGAHGRVVNVSTAYAEQSTSTTPVYYKARNRVLYWRKRRSPLNVMYAVVYNLAKLLLQDLARHEPGWRNRAYARGAGLIDGFSGRLRFKQGSVREK